MDDPHGARLYSRIVRVVFKPVKLCDAALKCRPPKTVAIAEAGAIQHYREDIQYRDLLWHCVKANPAALFASDDPEPHTANSTAGELVFGANDDAPAVNGLLSAGLLGQNPHDVPLDLVGGPHLRPGSWLFGRAEGA